MISLFVEKEVINLIYLDNCSTTRPRKEVIDEISLAMAENFSNPSSLHRLGMIAEKSLKSARETIGDFIGVLSDEIIFTSGGTESNNLAIQGALKTKKEKHIITTRIEHPAVLNTIKDYELRGYEITYLENDQFGRISLDSLRESLKKETALIAIIHINNELGTIQDLEGISKVILKANSKAFFHVDGVQSFGKIPLLLKKYNIDSYSFSSHKVHGPKGVGGLYLNSQKKIKPLFYGGSQERRLRPGTENLEGVLGFARAVKILANKGDYERNKVEKLKKSLLDLVSSQIGDVKINSPSDSTGSPYIVNMSFKDIKGEVLLHYLEDKGIFVSTGSACSSKNKDKSHVLRAINLSKDYLDSSIRICFSYENTLEEVEYMFKVLKESIEDIRLVIKGR